MKNDEHNPADYGDKTSGLQFSVRQNANDCTQDSLCTADNTQTPSREDALEALNLYDKAVCDNGIGHPILDDAYDTIRKRIENK
jgi:hypothetical protein